MIVSKPKQKIISALFGAFLLSSAYSIWLSYSLYSTVYHQETKVLTRYQEELKTEFIYKKVQNISLAFVLALCLLVLCIGIRYSTKRYHWWIVVALLSTIFLIDIGIFWFINSERKLQKHPNHLYIANQNSLNTFLSTINTPVKKFITVPTGILVEQIQFTQSPSIVFPGMILHGYIWQQYAKGIHDSLEQAIIMPDMIQGAIEKLFTKETASGFIVGWRFYGTFSQDFDLSYYPFDHRHVKVHVVHKNFEQNVICVPDFTSYDLSGNFIGINSDIAAISEWTLRRSFFSYTIHNFGCSLGVENFLSKEFPQYYFYIIAKRDLLDTIIQYLIILIIAAIMFFITLMTFEKNGSSSSALGFSTAGTLGITSGILFVLLTSHIALRSSIHAEGTIYFDFIYLIYYVLGIFLTINSLRFAFQKNTRMALYNFVIPLLYWPLFLFSILCVTVGFFY